MAKKPPELQPAVPNSDIEELVEVRIRDVNDYLRHDYQFLAIQSISISARHPTAEADKANKNYYVRRYPVYVLGRPPGVEPWSPPPKPPKEA